MNASRGGWGHTYNDPTLLKVRAVLSQLGVVFPCLSNAPSPVVAPHLRSWAREWAASARLLWFWGIERHSPGLFQCCLVEEWCFTAPNPPLCLSLWEWVRSTGNYPGVGAECCTFALSNQIPSPAFLTNRAAANTALKQSCKYHVQQALLSDKEGAPWCL